MFLIYDEKFLKKVSQKTLRKEAEKKVRLEWDSKSSPFIYQCSVQPSELSSQLGAGLIAWVTKPQLWSDISNIWTNVLNPSDYHFADEYNYLEIAHMTSDHRLFCFFRSKWWHLINVGQSLILSRKTLQLYLRPELLTGNFFTYTQSFSADFVSSHVYFRSLQTETWHSHKNQCFHILCLLPYLPWHLSETRPINYLNS